ncbi:MAG: hypothetical protein EPN56_04575 [Rhodanobacter sp.]|nr:MAG: hypothetical protein EPN78_02100 [Rhodanobacter sp.]TAM10436.1 MAG: hypothetical protein EPN66_09770 [Rhodanobacter sp.]TAM36734.1 MAG: hypothetical protein EPN56_04575 [Rhodanobacter sp.]
MSTRINLFGALREADPRGYVELELPTGSTVAGLSAALVAHLAVHAPAVSASLVRHCVFATDTEILHDHREVPAGVTLAVLPPVSGG